MKREICKLYIFKLLNNKKYPKDDLPRRNNIQSNMHIKATQGTLKCDIYEQLPFIYILKLYTLFINEQNETALYRQ